MCYIIIYLKTVILDRNRPLQAVIPYHLAPWLVFNWLSKSVCWTNKFTSVKWEVALPFSLRGPWGPRQTRYPLRYTFSSQWASLYPGNDPPLSPDETDSHRGIFWGVFCVLTPQVEGPQFSRSLEWSLWFLKAFLTDFWMGYEKKQKNTNTNSTNSSNKNKTKIGEAKSGHFPELGQVTEKVDMQKNTTMAQTCKEKLRQNQREKSLGSFWLSLLLALLPLWGLAACLTFSRFHKTALHLV